MPNILDREFYLSNLLEIHYLLTAANFLHFNHVGEIYQKLAPIQVALHADCAGTGNVCTASGMLYSAKALGHAATYCP